MVLPAFNGVTGAVIDIGANIGDTAAAVRSQIDNEIVCFEGDDKFLPYLKRNATMIGGITIVDQFVETRKASRCLDHIKQRPALIKTDTDGLDCEIITSFLSAGDFNFYFELDPSLTKEQTGKDTTTELISELIKRGYAFTFFSNWGHLAGIFDAKTPIETIFCELNGKAQKSIWHDVFAFEPCSLAIYDSAKNYINKHFV